MAGRGQAWRGKAGQGKARFFSFERNGMAIVKWKLTGITPLMQSNPESMLEDSAPKDEDSPTVTKKKKYNDKQEAEIRTYRHDGHFCHPTSAFRVGLLKAGVGRKFGKTSAATMCEGGVFPVGEFVVICDAKFKPAKKYVIDKRSVVIGGSRILRCRPKFETWTMIIELEVDAEIISAEQVTQLLNVMGSKLGLGEYRPERDFNKKMKGAGTFGRFSAELVK